MLGGYAVGDVGESRGALVGRYHEIGIIAIVANDVARRHDGAIDDVVGDVEQAVDEALVAGNALGQYRIAVAGDRRALDEKATLGTDRNYHRFKADPATYSNSEAFYKMLMMAVVLYEDYGVRYNPKWITSPEATPADDHFFADSRDILLHGLVGPQHLGTCSSMPILYIALGRRLD